MFQRPMMSLHLRTAALVCLLFVVMIGSRVQAQAFYLGPKAAYQSVWVLNQNNYGLSEMDYEITAGPSYGFSLGADWGEHWGMQVEFQVSHQGQNYADNIGLQLILGINDVFDVRKELDLVYGQVPILARYRSSMERVAFLGLLGPQIGVRGATTMQYSADGDTIPFAVLPGGLYPDLLVAEDFFRSIDIGIAGGAGLEWFLGPYVYARLLGRFYLGLSDINVEATQGAPDYGASRHATIGAEFGLGVRIPVTERRSWGRAPGR